MKGFPGRLRILLTVLLTLTVLASAVPLPAFADIPKTYLSEIRICVCGNREEAFDYLTGAGYTVLDMDLNAGVGAGLSCVWLGYRTTTDPEQAITDIAVLNMNGGYFLADSGTLLEERKETVSQMAQDVLLAVKCLAEAQKAGSAPADYAVRVLNLLTEDDSGMPLGTFLISDDTDVTPIVKLLTEGNVTAVALMLQMLYLGNGAEDGTALLSALAGREPTDSEADCLPVAERLFAGWETVSGPMAAYADAPVGAEADEKTLEVYLDRLNSAEKGRYYLGKAFVAAAETVMLGGEEPESVAAFLSGRALQAQDLCFAVGAMREGQRAVASYLTPDIVLFGGIPASAASDLPKKDGPMSVYAGIDRRIFDADGFALTEEAKNYSGENGDVRWLRDASGEQQSAEITDLFSKLTDTVLSESLRITYGAPVPDAGAIGAVLRRAVQTVYPMTFAESLSGLSVGELSDFSFFSRLSAGAMMILGSAYAGMNVYSEALPQYKKIPGRLIHIRKDRSYTDYYAVKQTVFSPIESMPPDDPEAILSAESYGVYADLNGWCGREWNALYVTKDPAAGKPILADAIYALADQGELGLQMSFAHAFSSTMPYNLNSYAYEDALNGIYLYFWRDTEYGEKTVTVYNQLDLCLAIGGATVGGIIIGAVIVFVANEKKKRRTEEE